MLIAATLGAALATTRPVSAVLQLQCYITKDTEPNRFSLLIDREALVMRISSNRFGSTTMPVSITPTQIVGRGYTDYDRATYEIGLPELKVRVTTIPHIWPGKPPELVAEGRCAGSI